MNIRYRRYAAFLRGVNVGGKNRIAMAGLERIFTGLGYEEVKTYIQSGNVVFRTEEQPAAELEAAIEKALSATMGTSIVCIVRTDEELRAITEQNPFTDKDSDGQYIVLLKDSPAAGKLEKIPLPGEQGELFRISGRKIYLFCPKGYGRTKFNNNFFESKLGVPATTRNLKTIEVMSELTR